ncbi:MAG TPA: transposase [Chloroflexia bacterium]|nr:transposase [Chloroflexia bacterium]
MPDHVHLLVGCDPAFGIHRLVKFIKRASSHLLRKEFPELNSRLPSLWTNRYFCFDNGRRDVGYSQKLGRRSERQIAGGA